MNILPKGNVAILISMFLAWGCRLENPLQFGEHCPGMSYIQESNGRCARGTCSQGNVYFEAERCPESQRYCIEIPGEEVYCSSECPDRTHEVNSDDAGAVEHICEADTVEHCGSKRENCSGLIGWGDGRCGKQTCTSADCDETKMICIAEKCLETYKLVSGVCKQYSMCCGAYCRFTGRRCGP